MRRYFRAYPAISSRQQGADRLVYNETDLRAVLWQAVDPAFEGERPSTIRLAADIYLTKPIELGAYQYNVSIEGGGKFAIAEGSTFVGTYLFGLPDGTIEDVSFVGCIFECSTLLKIFGGSALTIFNDLQMLECNIAVPAGGVIFGEPITLNNAEINFDDQSAFGIGPGVSLVGTVSFGPYLYQYENTRVNFSRSAIGVGCGTAIPRLSLDVDGGFRVRPASVTLQDANPSITVGDRTTFQITIDNATATGDIQLTDGYVGQILILYFTNTATSLRLSDGANIDTNKNYHSKHPLQHETVTFIWLNGKWREMARSENT